MRQVKGKFFNDIFNLKSLVKKSKKIYSFSSKIAFAIVLAQISILTILLVDTRYDIKMRASTLIKKISPIKPLDSTHPNDYLKYFSDLAYSLTSGKSLPRIDLNLNYESILGLECTRQKNNNCSENNIWNKGTLITDDNKFKVKLRSKGDREMHRRNFKSMSFKVDIKGEKRYSGMEEFSIQIPTIRNYTSELFASKIFEKFSIAGPRHKYVRLYVNGEYLGIRHIEESFSRELIESSSKRYGPIFSLNEEKTQIFEKSEFDLADKRYWSNNNNKLARQALSILRGAQGDSSYVSKYFDMDLWAKYFAISDALNVFHGLFPKSVKFYLNPSTGLIEPVFYDGHYTNMEKFDEFHLSNFLSKNYLEECEILCQHSFFFSLFFGTFDKPNIPFYKKYYDELDKFSSTIFIQDVILPAWDSFKFERGSLYKEFWRKDKGWIQGVFPHIGAWNPIDSRLKNIRDKINISKLNIPKISISDENNNLRVINKDSQFPQIIYIKCSDGQAKNYLLIKNKPIDINLDCKYTDIKFSLGNNNNFIPLSSIMVSEEPNLKNKNISLIKGTKYIIKPGFTTFDYPVVFDGIKNLIFSSGAKICLKPNAYIIVRNSNVIFQGTPLEPVEIYSCESNNISNAVLIENSKVNISNLRLENLSYPVLPLRVLYGSINFVRSKIDINSLTVVESSSEDGINFIDSNVFANEINITGSFSDALDSDYSDIHIVDLNCSKIGNDCLDLSFSDGLVENIKSEFIDDKVISLGESSKLVIEKANVENAEIGIVSKDSSELTVNNFIHKNLNLVLAAYVKKPEFGNPSVEVLNIYPEIKNSYLIGKGIKAIVKGKQLEGAIKSSKVEKMLYGNLYGKKTIRQ